MTTTLNCLKSGKLAKVLDLTGEPGFISRATAIGFCPGVDITVLRNTRAYPMLVHLNDTRIAIDRIEAGKVVVDEKN